MRINFADVFQYPSFVKTLRLYEKDRKLISIYYPRHLTGRTEEKDEKPQVRTYNFMGETRPSVYEVNVLPRSQFLRVVS
jgi:hypothetical protein